MRLPSPLRIPNPLLQNLLRLLNKLPMQIQRIPIHAPHSIVLPQDVIRRLLIVLVHHCAVALALVRKRVRCRAIAAFVGFVRLMDLSEFGDCGAIYARFLGIYVPCRDMRIVCLLPGARGRAGGRTRLRRSCCWGG